MRAATAEARIIVTEDASTFGVATAQVPGHVGVVYCHHGRFPRTRPGLQRLYQALIALAYNPPDGLGEQPIEWWLRADPGAGSAGSIR